MPDEMLASGGMSYTPVPMSALDTGAVATEVAVVTPVAPGVVITVDPPAGVPTAVVEAVVPRGAAPVTDRENDDVPEAAATMESVPAAGA